MPKAVCPKCRKIYVSVGDFRVRFKVFITCRYTHLYGRVCRVVYLVDKGESHVNGSNRTEDVRP